jgi:microcystin-dependent protein|tara:strand:+ start:294 stop:2348 length:2055 start_codon:yes stop_codon:yes gene_type:complete
MPYTISYTDTVNKGTITVADNTLNNETSLNFPGRGTTAYGQSVNENFLHLLENFANTTAPARPVEGQLWYDSTQGVDQLKVYDGTNWVASGGLKKASAAPAVANSSAGDLWVNTESQQLYLFTGSTWVLVGPDFSDGLLTGAQAQAIIGTDDITYNVLVIKVEDQPVIIISSQSFIPKVSIKGFRTGINPGMNIADEAIVGVQALKYFGTSEKAEALVVGNTVIPASNFLRGNAASSTDFQLSVKSNDGIKIGTGGQLSLGINGETGVIQHNTSGSSIDIKMRNGNLTPTVVSINSDGNVGFNNSAPEQAVDVRGNIKISPKTGEAETGVLQITSTGNSTSIGTGSIVTTGGVGIALNAYIGGDIDVGGILQTGNIIPDSNATRNIGTSTNKYEQIHATTFFGNIQGNVSGTVSGRAGSADRLASATTFALSGDVEPNSFEFDGQTGGSTKTFAVSIANSFISNKEVTYDAENADELLLNVTTGTTGVKRITKRNFLKTIPLVPAGAMMPFGGEESPEGWLLCDGSEVNKSDYNVLWLAIQHNFKDASLVSDNGVAKFTLPDFRGRFALGLDDMGGPSANRVTDIAADAIGGNAGLESTTVATSNLPEHEHDLEGDSGTQFYGVRVGAGEPVDSNAITLPIEPGLGGTQGIASSGGIKTETALGTPLNVMNPFLAVNYIIYTGA